MRVLVVDASTLVAELVRERGRRLLARSDVRFVVAEDQWDETQRKLRSRFDHLRARIGDDRVDALTLAIGAVMSVVEVIPRPVYEAEEARARRRIRDPNDWPTVALSLVLDAPILTADRDFFGTGVATWTYDALAADLEAEAAGGEEPSPAPLVRPWWMTGEGRQLPDESLWVAAAVRALQAGSPDASDLCYDCGLPLPLDFTSEVARLPCPRCVQTQTGDGLRRAYRRTLHARL